jgi:hypothetical protein
LTWHALLHISRAFLVCVCFTLPPPSPFSALHFPPAAIAGRLGTWRDVLVKREYCFRTTVFCKNTPLLAAATAVKKLCPHGQSAIGGMGAKFKTAKKGAL